MIKKSKRKAGKKTRPTGLKPKASNKRPSPHRRRPSIALPATTSLKPVPVGAPQLFTTPASSSGNQYGKSTTSGLRGTLQKYDDGSVVIEATEQMTASRTGGMNGSLTASCRRVRRDNITAVTQLNYSYKNRVLPESILTTDVLGFTLAVPEGFNATSARGGVATQFGKNDRDDEGTGSPDMGLVQTNSEVFGASLKISIMENLFGQNWRTNSKRLNAMIDVLFAEKKPLVRVPLVDVGPGENLPSHAEVDLMWASDQFLGTNGEATVQYRVLLPS
jgi:hypothetical protein